MSNDNMDTDIAVNTAENNTEGMKPSDTLKMFSQDDVNKMISERLTREKGKMLAEVEKQKAELEHKEFLLSARSQLIAAGHPESFIDIVNTSSQKDFENSLSALNDYTKKIRESVANEFLKGRGIPVLGDSPNSVDSTVRNAMGL